MTGRVIGHYRLIDKLGEGGMGKVYRAIDTMVEREVAMKSLKPELASRPDVLERFRSEATLLAKLNHPNIAQLYSFFKDGNEFFMVMEYVPGKTLEKLIQERGALPWRRAVEIAAQMLDGIQHAHTLGEHHLHRRGQGGHGRFAAKCESHRLRHRAGPRWKPHDAGRPPDRHARISRS